jgi:hypothetical protein
MRIASMALGPDLWKRPQTPTDKFALTFVTGILAGARKLTHVAHLRSDVMLAHLIAVTGIPSQ